MPSTRSSVRTPVSKKQSLQTHDFEAEFVDFATCAWSSFDSKTMTPASWARDQARAFYHSSKNHASFLSSYGLFLTFASDMLKLKRSRALDRDANLIAAVIPEVSTYSDQGHKELNSVLFAEYEKWWDAFVEEAAEDKNDSASAEDRFSYHCANILRRMTGLKEDILATVVSGWLISHHS